MAEGLANHIHQCAFTRNAVLQLTIPIVRQGSDEDVRVETANLIFVQGADA